MTSCWVRSRVPERVMTIKATNNCPICQSVSSSTNQGDCPLARRVSRYSRRSPIHSSPLRPQGRKYQPPVCQSTRPPSRTSTRISRVHPRNAALNATCDRLVRMGKAMGKGFCGRAPWRSWTSQSRSSAQPRTAGPHRRRVFWNRKIALSSRFNSIWTSKATACSITSEQDVGDSRERVAFHGGPPGQERSADNSAFLRPFEARRFPPTAT